MSTSTYYNFIASNTAADRNDRHRSVATGTANRIEAQRRTAPSPSSFTTSSSDSSSSLSSQFNSLSIHSTSSITAYSSAASTSSSSSTSSTTSNTNLLNQTNQANSMIATTRSLAFNQHDLVRRSSVTPTQLGSQHQLYHSYTLHSLEPKPLKPFKSQSAYIEAMKEDLAEWLNGIYGDLDLTPENIFCRLETGAIICRHANNVTQMGRNLMSERTQFQTLENTTSSGVSDNENSLGHESIKNLASLSSPSPDHSLVQEGCKNQQLYQRHRLSETNGSISSIRTNGFSPTGHRLSLTNTSFGSMQSDRTIDWFRVKVLNYKSDAMPGTFFARDNICQFILWCRSLNIIDCLLFETDDLVARKNEKSFILCLLEVARIGFKVGMPTPLIIQLEQEIDREIENEAKLGRQSESARSNTSHSEGFENNEANKQSDRHACCEDSNNNPYRNKSSNDQLTERSKELGLRNTQPEIIEINEGVTHESDEDQDQIENDSGPKPQVITNDLLSLHEKVVQLLCQCTCPTQFPMVRIGDGKYKIGDKLIIFVRILRRHIMVRVGGGWQELSEFLRQKDPCRTKGTHLFGKHNQTSPPLPSPSQHASVSGNNNTSIPVSRSRLVGSSLHLNKGHLHYRSSRGAGTSHKLISGSASMSWLSHNT